MSFQIELNLDIRHNSGYFNIFNNDMSLVSQSLKPGKFYLIVFAKELLLINVDTQYTVDGITRALEVAPMMPVFQNIKSIEFDGLSKSRLHDNDIMRDIHTFISKYFTVDRYLAVLCVDFSNSIINRPWCNLLGRYGVKSEIIKRGYPQSGSWGAILYHSTKSIGVIAEKQRPAGYDNFVYFPESHHHTYINRLKLIKIMNEDTTLEEVLTLPDVEIVIFYLYASVLNVMLSGYSQILTIVDRFQQAIDGTNLYTSSSFATDQESLKVLLSAYINMSSLGALTSIHDQSSTLISKIERMKSPRSPFVITLIRRLLTTVVNTAVDINYKIINPVLNDQYKIYQYFLLLGRLGYI